MNTPFMQQETLSLSTLSPVHIGCGDDYEPSQYVVDDNNLWFLGETAILKALSTEQLNALAQSANSNSLAGLRKSLHDKKEQLIPFALHRVNASSHFCDYYSSRLNNAQNNLEIKRTAFNPHSQKPYIPGSSIKGTIRTAILDALNKGKALQPRPDKNHAAPRGANKTLESSLLNYSKVDQDPMKHLKIGDALLNPELTLPPCSIQFAVNHKRKPVKEKAAGNSGVDITLESIHEGLSHAFTFDWRLNNNKEQALKSCPNFATIAQHCNQYYLPQLKQELQKMGELNLTPPQWKKDIEHLLSPEEELGKALNNNQAFLLRLGRYGGADFKTLNGVRHIKIMAGPKPATYQQSPTTWWLAANHNKQTGNFLPFGWVVVQRNSHSNELPKLHTFLQNLRQPYQEEHQRQQQLDERRQQQVKALLQQQEQAAQAAAKKAAAEKAQTQARAAMSAEQQAMHALQDRANSGESKGQGPGCQMAADLTDMIQQAVESWSNEDRNALHSIACDIYQHLNIDRKKNKKVKARLQELLP